MAGAFRNLRRRRLRTSQEIGMSKIMFVCTGNVCRSPMATGLLRQRLEAEGLGSSHEVVSTGTWALDDLPASPNAVTVMAERGIDISQHIAQTITAEAVAGADLILVMSREHAQVLQNTWPQYGWKVHLLSEMVGQRRDVRDPYGGSLQEYRACADTVARYIEAGFQRILELS
jgi:protein-tyrosine-phosphatase